MATKCPKCQAENPDTELFCGDCGTQLSPSGPPHVSKTLTLETYAEGLSRGTLFASRYEIIEELGSGGMGRVYRVFDKKIEEEVALKLIRPDIAAEKRTVERFRNEIKIARKITHKNICRTHDIGEEGKSLFITMEYVRGEDLKSLVKKTGTLAAGTAVSIARQVGEGLAEAHKLGIVHRDLKPSNIMIDTEGNAKIMDFGIARSLAGSGTTVEGVIIGTPEYMSPEQAEGKEADQRADIYALGVILFEMVTGRPLFDGETALAIAHKHRYEPAPDPRAFNPQVSDDLGRLILRCVEKEREKRYQTTEDLLADLAAIEAALPTAERVMTGRVSTKRRPTPSKTISVKITPRKLIIPAAALVVLMAGAIALIKFLPRKEPAPTPGESQSIAVLPFADLSPDKNQAAWCDGIAETILNSLTNVRSLQVRGRHSSFMFKAQDDPREVGQKLKADKLLTGSLQKLGSKIRITVQLIDTADGRPVWSEKHDGEMEEIFDIQDIIASVTLAKLNIGLTNEDASRLKVRATNNKEAYELYLKGNFFMRQATIESTQKAISFFLDAVKSDPAYALPQIALARCYKEIYIGFGEGEKDEAYRQSKEALTRALDLDEEMGEAYSVRAGLKFDFENDPAGAEIDFQRALELSPRSPVILEDHFWYLAAIGRLDEAVSDMKFLVELEPLFPAGYTWLGIGHYFLRRYDEAVAYYQKALELDPFFINALGWSFHSYIAVGDYEKARMMVNRLENRWEEGYFFDMAILAASIGNNEEAAKRKEAAKEVFKNPVFAAPYYAVIGDKKQTLLNLTRIYDEFPPSTRVCFLWHYYDKYRSNPEFVSLFRKAGLELSFEKPMK